MQGPQESALLNVTHPHENTASGYCIASDCMNQVLPAFVLQHTASEGKAEGVMSAVQVLHDVVFGSLQRHLACLKVILRDSDGLEQQICSS